MRSPLLDTRPQLAEMTRLSAFPFLARRLHIALHNHNGGRA